MNKKSLMFGAFCGPAAFLCVGLGWAWIAGFVPPPPPLTGAEDIAAELMGRRTGILAGSVLMSIGAAGPYLVFIATLSALLSRIERGLPIFTFGQMICGLFAGIVMLTSSFLWIAAVFRPERDPAIVQTLNDFAWLFVLSPFSFAVLQNSMIGMAILGDRDPQPLFPRWVAYFNFWTGFLYIPAALIPFFKLGPFAWDGLIAFWLVLFVFAAWTAIMPWAMFRAVKRLPSDA